MVGRMIEVQALACPEANPGLHSTLSTGIVTIQRIENCGELAPPDGEGWGKEN
jgi:hypothetical protein